MARVPPRGNGQRRGGSGCLDGRFSGEGCGRGERGQQPARLPPPPAPLAPQNPIFSEPSILRDGLACVGFPVDRQKVQVDLNKERLRSFYGVSPKAVQAILTNLRSKGNHFPISKLFMTLNWLRLYNNKHVLAGRWNLSGEVIRNKVKKCCAGIQLLKAEKIKWIDRDGVVFVVSVDGVHCCIYEPRTDPGSKWYNHEFHGPGVSYELAISLYSNNVISIRGPFPASAHDITIFRGGKKDDPKDASALIFKIKDGQKAIGDSGYQGEPEKIAIIREGDSLEVKKFKARAKSRHESFNSRWKIFQALDLPFRHGFDLHQMVFEAICILCQYDIENGHGLMQM